MLRKDAIDELRKLGSNFAELLAFHESLVLVKITGQNRTLFEAARTRYIDTSRNISKLLMTGTNISTELHVPKKLTERCSPDTPQDPRHRIFCDTYDGYGNFCLCNARLSDFGGGGKQVG